MTDLNPRRPQLTDPNATTAYRRTHPRGTPPWKHDIERALDRLDDFYCALWDWMPAIGAVLTLAFLLAVTPHR